MLPEKQLALEDLNINTDDLKYSSPAGKYSFQFLHLGKGVFLLKSKGYADEISIKTQINAGEEARTRLAQQNPEILSQLIWDISELHGASTFARYAIMIKVVSNSTYGSINLIGANNVAKSFIKIISSLTPHLSIYFYKTVEDATHEAFNRISNNGTKESKLVITTETKSYANFTDLWQKFPNSIKINLQKYKILQLDEWSYVAHDNNYKGSYSVIEGNIILLKCEGFIKAMNVEKTYQMLEDIMNRMGHDNSENKFYSVLDLQKVKGITLSARKLTNYYEKLYKDRAHLVIMIPSSMLGFALKVQKKINPDSFKHWEVCKDIADAFEMINKREKGSYQLCNASICDDNSNVFEIPDSKIDLIKLVNKLYYENQLLKHHQNEHIQRILEITGRMTWDTSFNIKWDNVLETSGPFTDVYNALSVVHDDFQEIIREKLVHAQKLRESEDKYWNLINLANDVIVVYQEKKCKLINSRVTVVTGYTPEEIKIKTPADFLPTEEYERIKNLAESNYDQSTWYFETHLIHKDGHSIPVSVSVGSIMFENEPAEMYIIRDITSKKKAEAELEKYRNHLEVLVADRTRQLEKEILERETAQKSDRLKSAFLSNMSHEIRTPMNAIIAFTNFLRNPELTESQRDEYINYIQSSGQSLLNLINDIIDISKIEAKQINVQKTNCPINPILEELYILFDEAIKRKGCEGLKIELVKKQSHHNLVIHTDPYRLKQILSNLLHNALKFTEKGTIEFGYEIKEQEIEFYVKDTGIGIAEDKIAYIFQRFGKIETTEKNRGGTGLGLAISQNLALLLEGNLLVESTPGKGSTFFLRLPFHGEQHIPFISQFPAYVEKKIYKWNNKKILVAEDEELNFKVIQIALQNTQAEIIRAKDGIEAVNAVTNDQTIDLILMDIQMPGMDGYEALKRIKKINFRIPIIAQTAFALIEEKDNCLHQGFQDYISKPLKLSELMIKIDKLIS